MSDWCNHSRTWSCWHWAMLIAMTPLTLFSNMKTKFCNLRGAPGLWLILLPYAFSIDFTLVLKWKNTWRIFSTSASCSTLCFFCIKIKQLNMIGAKSSRVLNNILYWIDPTLDRAFFLTVSPLSLSPDMFSISIYFCGAPSLDIPFLKGTLVVFLPFVYKRKHTRNFYLGSIRSRLALAQGCKKYAKTLYLFAI